MALIVNGPIVEMLPKDLLSLAVDGASERELSASWVDCESLCVSLHDRVPNLMTHRLTIVILGVIAQNELSQYYRGILKLFSIKDNI